ncbi:MAG: hypothetical protein HKN26_15880, partial [Acidimicrobiales bacterium]|nr:hypothetical protein [Acidimicrobiales bacterium]
MSASPRNRSLRRDRLRLRQLFRADAVAVRQSLVALVVSALTAVVAGVLLASITDTLEELPGLLLLVPAAIALRGNVFGALGSRLGTAIHTGTFVLRLRSDTVVGQNVIASIVLSLVTSVGVAVIAKGVAIAFAISPVMSLAEFIVVSVVGGLLASSLVLLISLLLAAGSVRFEWDLDNVTAPLVTATGDLVTVPALLVATWLLGGQAQSTVIAAVSAVLAIVGLILVARSSLDLMRRIVQESLPVLLLAGLLDLIAGITVQKRQDDFLAFEALLILLPGFLGAAGALGGILSSRLATGFHLGLVEPAPVPTRVARSDMRSVLALALPVFAVLGIASWVAAELGGFTDPGLFRLVAVALTAGVLATGFVIGVGYYGTLAAVRLG